ncbi:bifunctional folylpolyglutamate synthase/dihydrofolate synthase [Entomospira culicis]|uniref:Dihydrofolate synthase/folylpolyglutamate synthase n=1 Tax=Entomospira culicis TaxID=2719989 RepID=A0A968KZE4_9SPIO|nr:Mur ligase family protein [Entomospira culicis]NIZ19031.1 hypothetical protein [Entomospira culicis]NIZ69246.1 hypothetical protein [Entomospira culicis]WDI37830.1 Mur ligase family protein [Entomospira culicis]WDI39458.1 Mur ligase family protein [Entomospira culicis]
MQSYLEQLLTRRNPIHIRKEEARFSDILTILQDINIQKPRYKTIHLAGSKGKGSTAHAITATLYSLGYRTLLFTSPHLIDIKERFLLNLTRISTEQLHRALRWLQHQEDAYHITLPFFDAMTAMLFFLADSLPIDFLILETGLGGRLDATNLCASDITVITPIEREHTAILGDTLLAITQEKAGIIKPKTPLFIAKQAPQVAQCLEESAQKLGAPYFHFNALFAAIKERARSPFQQEIIYKERSFIVQFPTPMKVLAENALLALAVVDYLFPEHDIIPVWQESILSHQLPARYQKIKANIVLDASHTPSSFCALVQTFYQEFPTQEKILIFGCAVDKDFISISESFYYFDKIYFVAPKGIHQQMELLSQQYPQANSSYHPDLKTLLETLPLKKEQALLITGSFYLVAEALEHFH